VHDKSGQRTFTVVAAVACTGGDAATGEEGDLDDERTHLYATNLEVDCGTGNAQQFAVDFEGNYPASRTAPASPVEQVMVFRGLESLLNNATNADADKMYWNTAVGFKEVLGDCGQRQNPPVIDAGECTLRWSVTASKGPIEDVFDLANVTYPYIQADVDISDGLGKVVCGQHPVNGTGDNSGVSTEYTALGNALPSTFKLHMFQDKGEAKPASQRQ